MAMQKGGPAPAPLEPKVVKKLLDLLSTDNEFRRLFKQDAHAALVKAGYKPPTGAALKASGGQAALQSGGSCLQMASSDRIAPKAKIIRERAKIEKTLNAVLHFLCPIELKAN